MSAALAAAAAAMLSVIDDPLILRQERRFHFSSERREDYSAYVRPMEEALAARGLSLPEWDPSTAAPAELSVAKAAGDGRARRAPKKRLVKAFPGAPKEGELCALSPAALDEKLADWHDFVLEDLAGAADTEESSAVPLVWSFHAHLARLRSSRAGCPRR